ncbi:MAG: hypothetical protein AAB721_02830 [Patescibacteria group bacterium]
MAKFSVKMQRTLSTTLGVGEVYQPGTNMRRGRIYDMLFGSEAAPGDAAVQWQLQRLTATGTGTAVTARQVDPSEGVVASGILAKENMTVQGTLTANEFPFTLPLNQRASFRWVAPPDGEIVIPATASVGLALNTPVATTLVVATADIYFNEA